MTVYRLILAESDGPCEASFDDDSWWEWLHSPDPAIPEGQHSVLPGEGDMPASLWELVADTGGPSMPLTVGSYENDKAILILFVCQEAELEDAYEAALKSSPAGEMPDVREYHGYMY